MDNDVEDEEEVTNTTGLKKVNRMISIRYQ